MFARLDGLLNAVKGDLVLLTSQGPTGSAPARLTLPMRVIDEIRRVGRERRSQLCAVRREEFLRRAECASRTEGPIGERFISVEDLRPIMRDEVNATQGRPATGIGLTGDTSQRLSVAGLDNGDEEQDDRSDENDDPDNDEPLLAHSPGDGQVPLTGFGSTDAQGADQELVTCREARPPSSPISTELTIPEICRVPPSASARASGAPGLRQRGPMLHKGDSARGWACQRRLRTRTRS